MGLPNTRDITVIDGVTQLSASLMNDIQDSIAHLSTGVASVAAIDVDGVGGNAVTPPAGTVVLHGVADGTLCANGNANPGRALSRVGAVRLVRVGRGVRVRARFQYLQRREKRDRRCHDHIQAGRVGHHLPGGVRDLVVGSDGGILQRLVERRASPDLR